MYGPCLEQLPQTLVHYVGIPGNQRLLASIYVETVRRLARTLLEHTLLDDGSDHGRGS